MIVGISGTHGTGKSTILQGVKAAGYSVDETQLARSAQKALGWDKLSIAQESTENMWALQDAILSAIDVRDKAAKEANNVVVVERTPADLWAYTSMWCTRLGINPYTDWRAQNYKFKCRDIARKYSMILVVPAIPEVPFVEDPNRADLVSRDYVAGEISDFIHIGCLPSKIFWTSSKESRIAEAVQILQTISALSV
jgi:hypothetical protein